MTDALIERMHPAYEGERVSVDSLYSAIILLMAEDITAAEAKTALQLNTPEGDELDEILDTQPGILAGLLASHDWALRVRSVLLFFEVQMPDFQTSAQIRGYLGIPTPA